MVQEEVKYRLGRGRLMGDGVQRKNKWSEAGNFQGVMKEGDLASGRSMLPWGRGGGMVYPSAEIWTDGEGWETGGSFQKDFSARHFSLTHALWVLRALNANEPAAEELM